MSGNFKLGHYRIAGYVLMVLGSLGHESIMHDIAEKGYSHGWTNLPQAGDQSTH